MHWRESLALPLAIVVSLAACIACDSTRASANVDGGWEGQVALNTPNDSISFLLVQSDSSLYGNGYLRIGPQNDFVGPTYSPFQVAGTVSGGMVNLVISQGPATSRLRGRVVGDQMPVVFTYLSIGTYPLVLRRVPSRTGPIRLQETRLEH